ncbi:MAG: 4a-hydroxytetrahydrobiopterin dehydratase [Thiomargarita sp.]|nr:4a-hydroxytetrahydrobiopterin dehydratase [Thiomargarita sp.]
MTELINKRCKPCEGGIEPLTSKVANNLLKELENWQSNQDNSQISRSYTFNNYYETIAFVNAIAWVSHQEDHHPDLEVSYNRCIVRYSTHAIKGLSENDFICAAKINELLISPDDEPLVCALKDS